MCDALLSEGAIPLLLFGGELKISPKDLRESDMSEPEGGEALPILRTRAKTLRFGRRGSVSQWMA